MANPKTQLNENRESVLKSTTVEEALRFPELVPMHSLINADILYQYSHKTQLLKEQE